MLFRKVCLFACGLMLLCGLFACPFDSGKGDDQDDFSRACAAARGMDIGDVEMYLERYLRKNPRGEHRWQAWQGLLEISLDIRHDTGSAYGYLEIMLDEFRDDAERRRQIQLTLADLASKMLAHELAVTLWEAVSSDPGTPQETLAVVYRNLSRAYLQRLEFMRSKELLDRCLQLNVADRTKAECLYALSEAHVLTDKIGLAEQNLRDLLDMGIDDERLCVEAVFMLADVLEQQERIQEAEQLFTTLRDVYPNPKVIDIRLGAIKSRRGAAGQRK